MAKMVQFGNTGLEVSRLGLGGYPFGGVNTARDWDPFGAAGRKTAIATIHRALDLGISYIDTCTIQKRHPGSLTELGRASKLLALTCIA